MIDSLLADLRYALRTLRQSPGFTAVAVLTLTLGIGANTALFSVVDALLLRPLPFHEADRLVWIGGWGHGADREMGVTPADFLDYREQSHSFARLAASISETVPINLAGSGEPERLNGALVTTDYLDLFGVKPALGRTFVPSDEQVEAGGVVVLSHGLWARRFGGDPAIVGKTVTLDGGAHTVIGVMPATFHYPPAAELWKPFSFAGSPQSPMRSREFHMLRPVARLQPGVTMRQAQAEVETIARRLEALYPKTNTNSSLFLVSLQEHLVGHVRLTLLVLFGAAGCALLMACANVANLLLARAASRHREIALRAALGASQGRVVRQLLTESVTLALLGGAGGALLAWSSVKLFVALAANLPRSDEIGVNAWVLGFALLVAVLTGLLFGLAPALQSARPDLNEALKEAGRSVGSSALRRRTLNVLVAGEVALALVLLISAGLLVDSFVKLEQVSPGFDAHNLLTVRIDLPDPYAQPEKKALFFEGLQQRVAALPGVETVGLVTELPLTFQSADFWFRIEGRPELPDGQGPHADIRNVNHDYFRAMRIPLLRGRYFTDADVRGNARVVVISELLAQRFFAGEDPLGQHLRLSGLGQEPYEIIGIVGDVRHRGLDAEAMPTIYFPTLRLGYANLVIRSRSDPTSLAASVRRTVTAIDPNQPVANVKTMEQWVTEAAAQPRFRTLLLNLFAVAALLLSLVGIYGVVSYAVTQQTREIGLRVALGARTAHVLSLVLGQGMKPVLLGMAIGLVAALAVSRLLGSLLFEITPHDPLTFSCVTVLLVGAALAACLVPARRAVRVDPMVALRSE